MRSTVAMHVHVALHRPIHLPPCTSTRGHNASRHLHCRTAPRAGTDPGPQQQQQQQQSLLHLNNQPKLAPVVRSIRESDKSASLDLFKAYIHWYKASVPDDIIELTWQRIMAGGEGNHQGLVAEDSNGQVRGGGVGQALIDAVYSSADEQQVTKTYWQTHECNYRARGLYDKMGRKSQFILYERE